MPSKEHRKIFKIGASKGVTLPKPFLDYAKIEEGDEVLLLYNSIVLILPQGVTEDIVNKKADLIKKILE